MQVVGSVSSTINNPYYLDGELAGNDEFRKRLTSIASDGPDFFFVKRADGHALRVDSIFGADQIVIMLYHPDNSCWDSKQKMSVETAKKRIELFLRNDPAWDRDLRWEYLDKPVNVRVLPMLMLGMLIIALVCYFLGK